MSIIPAVTGVSVPERFAIPEPQNKRTCISGLQSVNATKQGR